MKLVIPYRINKMQDVLKIIVVSRIIIFSFFELQ